METWFMTYEYFDLNGNQKKGYQFLVAEKADKLAEVVERYRQQVHSRTNVMADSFQATSVTPV